MANPFGSDEMAGGYAACRPALHPRIMEIAVEQLGRREPFQRALDIGCGAGLSTIAIAPFARKCIGVDPAASMLKRAAITAPAAQFVAGAAEAIPLRHLSIDLITAAGSLNYANLDRFFPEAARVLKPNGVLVVYDFSPGRSFRGAPGLDEWFSSFMTRYPPPPHGARTLDPEILAGLGSGFRVQAHQHFEIGLTLTREFYIDYMMTETNVAAAAKSGSPRAEIRSWVARTLDPIWGESNREVLFRGYFVCLIPS
jgi:ubiquinone/menaquinone biosynthesis C-methylase UbiE